MRTVGIFVALVAIAGLLGGARDARAASADVEELKRQVQILQQRIDQLEQRERAQQQAAPPAHAQPGQAPATAAAVPSGTEPAVTGEVAEVKDRKSLDNQQEAAPRPGDLTLDPKYRGFTRIPNTKVLIKFNAKPRVDMTIDPSNTGDDNRFVTAKIPVTGQPGGGGGSQFNINAKGSQLKIDVRAPEIPGSPRFYYENDFYGSGGGEFPYRIRHLYGQYYNIIVGQTFSIFEDPDVWPDTVDYEGPNSAIFARRPLIRYLLPLDKEWQLNFGIEQPESEVDLTGQPEGARSVNHAPDGGMNVRWENTDVGHVQLANILRDIAVDDSGHGRQSTLGWGFNLAAGLNAWGDDTWQGQATYGHGLFRYSNDDFVNNDAGFDHQGNIEAIPYLGLMTGYTHHWTDEWRSTASAGYVHLDNTASQTADAYHQSVYASLNVVYQYGPRLSIGLEGLYGRKETRDGSDGEVYRVEAGLVYSIFD
jgi:hypothetical protein